MEQNSLKFSIIMPCYNSERYVKEAIDSVISQDYDNWELVVINDGSTDSTAEILNCYARKNNHIRILNKENGGYVSAINMGLDHVSGDFFLLMGSDDQLLPGLFSKITAEIEEIIPDMIAFRTIQFVDGVPLGIDSNTNFNTKECMFDSRVSDYYSMYPCHSSIFFIRDTSKCFRTKLLGELRFFGKYGYDADGIFSTLFSHKASSFMSLPIDGYHWTLRADSLSASVSLPKNLDRLYNWNSFFKAIKELPNRELTSLEFKYAKEYYHLAKRTAMMISQDDRKSFMILKRNIKHIPSILRRYGYCKALGIKSIIELLMVTKTPRCWAKYQRLGNNKVEGGKNG